MALGNTGCNNGIPERQLTGEDSTPWVSVGTAMIGLLSPEAPFGVLCSPPDSNAPVSGEEGGDISFLKSADLEQYSTDFPPPLPLVGRVWAS